MRVIPTRGAPIFPRLSEEMAERVAAYGTEELLPADTMVFERVGDVHSGSVKRVASSVGEGSVVVSAIHPYLNEQHSLI